MRQKASSLAKVTQPLLARYHPRKRVFDLLDNCFEFPVIWINGPAGCGKTTLVGSYLKEHKIRCLWYQADEGDGDPASFFYYMRQAVKVFSPRKRKSLPLFTPEYQTGLIHFTMRYFEYLYERMPPHSVIVIDNYHEVPASSVFHAVMRQGLSEIPTGIHVILISRTGPAPALARLAANRQMTIIGWNELRLTPEETAGLAELLAPGFISKEKVRYFHDLSDGWAAGVVLMSLRAYEDMEPGELVSRAPGVVFDYFASEVFEGMDASTQQFLLKTSFLPSMTINIAEKLTGCPDSGRILSDLARHNYFVERRFHVNAVYSYHPLFRAFLMERAKTLLSQETIIHVITEAASLLNDNGHVDDALDLITKAGGWKTMTRFLMDCAPSLLLQGRHRLVERLLSTIPSDTLNSSPWLLFWLGSSRLPFDTVQSMGILYEAYDQFKAMNDPDGFFLSWAGIASAIAFAYTSRLERVDDLIRDLDERRGDYDNLASEEIRGRVAVGMFSILTLLRPNHPDAGEWARLAWDLSRRSNNTDAAAQTLLYRLFYHWEKGVLKDLMEDIDAIHKLSREENLSELGRLFMKLGETQFYDFATMHEECLQAARAGIELARESGIHLWDTFLIGHAAMSCHNVGDARGASQYIDLLAPHADDPRPWVQVNMDFVKARHAMICGNVEEASRCAERWLQLEDKSAAPATFCMDRALYAHIMRHQGKAEQAEALLSQALSSADRVGSEHFKVIIQFIRAGTAFSEGRKEEGFEILRSALPLAREWGSLGSLWDIPSSTAYLCAMALEAGIEVDFVTEIIRRRHLEPDERALTLDAWPWPVKIYTLGSFRILKDGDPIRFSKKAQKVPLEMLKILLACEAIQVSEVSVADILWPDADGDLALQSCATTIHRLRKLLGSQNAILRQNGLLSMNPRCCWDDARAFERLLDKADELWNKSNSGEELGMAREITCSALELYHGAFLQDDTWHPYANSRRENLQNRYFKSLKVLGDHLMKMDLWEEARKIFEKGLIIDDRAEVCYQGLMLCLHHQGRKSEAMAVFERCRKTLDAKLGVKPSEMTEAIGRSLRTGKNT